MVFLTLPIPIPDKEKKWCVKDLHETFNLICISIQLSEMQGTLRFNDFANFTGEDLFGVFFNKVTGLQLANFFKRDTNASAFLWKTDTFKNTCVEEHRQATASGGVQYKSYS